MAHDGWEQVTVGELAAPVKNALVGGPFGSNLGSKDYVPSGVPVIRGQNLEPGPWVAGEFVFVTSAKARTLSANLARPGDLVFTQRGNTVLHGGQVAIVPEDHYDQYLVSQSQMKLTTDSRRADTRFLYFVFRSRQHADYLRQRAIVTGVPHTNLGILRDFKFLLPPLRQQRTIARILSALDDKIQVNRQMNETLEATARAIFQSWFVDFDPVRAKMDGQKPVGMDEETAGLFPDRFEECELGPVPRGWRVSPLPEAIEVNPKRALTKGIGAPYLDMKNMPTRGHRPLGVYPRAFGSGTKFHNGDTLVARITPCLENGKTAYVDFLEDAQTGWGSTEYIILHPKPPLPCEYAYFLARHDDFRSHAIQNMTGTSGRQRVPPDCFDSFPIVVPSEPVAAKFGQMAKTLMARIAANSRESGTLADLRDALLPRLLSGELRVPDADKLVEAAL